MAGAGISLLSLTADISVDLDGLLILNPISSGLAEMT